MTHQDIIDRVEALDKEHSTAYAAEEARIAKEAESIKELCAGIGEGHFFASQRISGVIYRNFSRTCVFCRRIEPASEHVKAA